MWVHGGRLLARLVLPLAFILRTRVEDIFSIASFVAMLHRYRPRRRFRHANMAVGSCIDMCGNVVYQKLVSFGLSGQVRYPVFGLRNTFSVS